MTTTWTTTIVPILSSLKLLVFIQSNAARTRRLHDHASFHRPSIFPSRMLPPLPPPFSTTRPFPLHLWLFSKYFARAPLNLACCVGDSVHTQNVRQNETALSTVNRISRQEPCGRVVAFEPGCSKDAVRGGHRLCRRELIIKPFLNRSS